MLGIRYQFFNNMLTMQDEKMRELLENSKSFALISESDASEESLLAKEALRLALKNKGSAVYAFPPVIKNLDEKWSSILPKSEDSPLLYSTSILIPKNRITVKEISYAEDDKNISINISSSREELAKESIILKSNPIAVDALFYFPPTGANQINKNLIADLSRKILAPSEEKTVIISNGSDQDTVSENVFRIIQKIEASTPIEKTPIPNLLLASLLVETDNFERQLSESKLDLASAFLKMGAAKKNIMEIINKKSNSFVRILGRAMARSVPNESLKSTWTFLSSQDLEKTDNETAERGLFCQIIRKITNITQSQPVFILIWQAKESEVWAMIEVEPAGHASLKEKIRHSLSAQAEGGYLLAGPYKNFSEAELKIQNTLKEAL